MKRINDSLTKPFCQCEDWRNTGLPCKHMVACIMLYKCLKEFPIWYRDCPFFTKDDVFEENLFTGVHYDDDIGTEDLTLISEPTVTPLPQPVRCKRNFATACRERLQQLKGITYTIGDDEVLEELYNQLSESVDFIKEKDLLI